MLSGLSGPVPISDYSVPGPTTVSLETRDSLVLSVIVYLFPIECLHTTQDQWITCVGEEIFSSLPLGSCGWSVNEIDIR